MATTTNYSWSTPDDTALVKDGASAIRTLGSSIDTTTKALNPSTTLGDIEYRSSTANTNTRLGIGSTGQVLTVAGGVPSWATASSGGMTLISTTTLSGATTTLSSIPQTYVNLFLKIYNVTNNTNSDNLRIAPNGNTSISTTCRATNAGFARQQDDRMILTNDGATVLRTESTNFWGVSIFDYASTTNWKGWSSFGIYITSSPGADVAQFSFGGIQTNTEITSLDISQGGGTFSGGTVELWGVK
jgi:hypothetical protein